MSLNQTLPHDRHGAKVHDPTSQFAVSDIDEAGVTKYYGYVAHDGYWYIMAVTATTVRYCTTGYAAYSDAWTNRATLTYGLFSEVF